MKTIERVILLALMRDMRLAGYEPVAVWDGYKYWHADENGEVFSSSQCSVPDKLSCPLTNTQALRLLRYSISTPTLHFSRKDSDSWGNRGVFIVLGNGEDCISDYHACADFDRIIGAICKRIDSGDLP